MSTKYPYAAGADPQYDAWLSQYNYGRDDAQQQNQLRVGRDNEDYHTALVGLDKQAVDQHKNVETSMLSRGMFQSGETGVRQTEVDTNTATAKGAADLAYQREMSNASSDLQRALATLDLQNEHQIGGAVGRQNARDQQAAAQAEQDRQTAAEADRTRQQQDRDRAQQDQIEAQQAAADQAAADAQSRQAASDAAWQQQQAQDASRFNAYLASLKHPNSGSSLYTRLAGGGAQRRPSNLIGRMRT